jgi:hypothetical protein
VYDTLEQAQAALTTFQTFLTEAQTNDDATNVAKRLTGALRIGWLWKNIDETLRPLLPFQFRSS